MPDFAYVAKDENGVTVRGTLTAPSEFELGDKLSAMGYLLVYSQPSKWFHDFSIERISRKDLISFTVHLSTVISAGIPLLTGLMDMSEQTEKKRFRRVIEDLARNVQGGSSLSQAMGKHPRVFSELYVNMISAGETTGNIEGVLNDLIDFLGWQDDLAAEVTQALIYPIVILGAGILLVFFLLSFVLPRFMLIFQKAKVTLPLPTRILLGLSHFFSNYWYFIALAIVGIAFILRYTANTKRGRLLIDRIKLNIPIFGPLVRKVALSRFSHYMASLLKAGIHITEALWVAERVIGNAVLARVIRQALIRVEEGESLSDCLRQSGEFPKLIVRMLAIGEKTSSLEMTLTKASEHYDKEVPYTIKKIFSIFEPVIIVLIGVIVVGIALSMFLPMYQMIRLMSH